jgi:prevent-host-death family protein
MMAISPLVKVRTAELKNHLSRYLRRVRENHETIVVCDREVPVAVLAPIEEARKDSEWQKRCQKMAAAFGKAGLAVGFPQVQASGLPEIIPAKAARGAKTSIVEEMRRSRDW